MKLGSNQSIKSTSLGIRGTCPDIPICEGGVAPCRRLWSGWVTLERIPSVSHMIVCVRCSIRGSGCPSRNWGLKYRSRYPSAKKKKGRDHEWSWNQSLKTLTIRVSVSKLHPYIWGCWAYIWSGWENVPPIPRKSLDKSRGSCRTTLGSVCEGGRYNRYTRNPSDHSTRSTCYNCGS